MTHDEAMTELSKARTRVMMWSMLGQIPDEGYPRLVQDLQLCAGAIQLLVDKGHVYTPKEKK